MLLLFLSFFSHFLPHSNTSSRWWARNWTPSRSRCWRARSPRWTRYTPQSHNHMHTNHSNIQRPSLPCIYTDVYTPAHPCHPFHYCPLRHFPILPPKNTRPSCCLLDIAHLMSVMANVDVSTRTQYIFKEEQLQQWKSFAFMEFFV